MICFNCVVIEYGHSQGNTSKTLPGFGKGAANGDEGWLLAGDGPPKGPGGFSSGFYVRGDRQFEGAKQLLS